MPNLPDSLKGISHCNRCTHAEIESEFSEDLKGHKIPKHVLDKYLKIGNERLFQTFETLVTKVQPYWSITAGQFNSNIKGVIFSEWPFHEHNKSL